MPSESPTRMASTPAASASRAEGVSYAVTITMGSPAAFMSLRVVVVTRAFVLVVALIGRSFPAVPAQVAGPGSP
jgi:hypothetical protein